MATETTHTEATVGVPAEAEHHEAVNPLTPDVQMLIWTWVTFAIVAIVLYRVAWKPILSALEAREDRIRKAIEDAERARDALAHLEKTGQAMRDEAERECKAIIARARDAATEAASQVEKKAQERVRVLYENAERDIGAMKNKAIAELRAEQAGLIVAVSGKLIERNLDDARNRELVDKLLAEF